MDPNERALRDAIAADPDDDGALMVYADWLLERGDPYGELVVAGVARDEARIKRVWKQHYRTIMARLPAWAIYPDFDRGMIGAIAVERSIEDMLDPRTLAEILELAPIPVIKTSRAGGPPRSLLVRCDGRVAAVVAWDRAARQETVSIHELPSRRVVASEGHAMTRDPHDRLIPFGCDNRFRFAHDRDVFRYDLVPDRKATTALEHRELPFVLSSRR